MAYEALIYEKRGQVALITLNVPERLNAISGVLREDVHAAIAEAHEDDGVRAVVLTGAGRGFCSGADLAGPPGGRAPLPTPTQNTHQNMTRRCTGVKARAMPSSTRAAPRTALAMLNHLTLSLRRAHSANAIMPTPAANSGQALS